MSLRVGAVAEEGASVVSTTVVLPSGFVVVVVVSARQLLAEINANKAKQLIPSIRHHSIKVLLIT